MSGGPIFGAKGAIVRGVVSRSFQNEEHAYGAMVGPPIMHAPMADGRTLKTLMDSGLEGMAIVQAAGL